MNTPVRIACVLPVLGLLLVAGCGGIFRQHAFLGVPDDETLRLEEVSPRADRRLNGTVTMTAVRPATYQDYLRLKKAGGLVAQEKHNGYLYFATSELTPQAYATGTADASGNPMVRVTTRYRTKMPSSGS